MSERVLRWLVGLAVGAAVLPVVVAAARAIAGDWMPVWDNAYPTIRAWDVFSKNPPLVGTRSTAADMTGAEHVTHHPGPMEFYLIAPWLRLFGPAAGTVVGVALINVAAIGTVAWLTFRRGKHLATVVAMAGMAAITWSMGSEMLFDPWPPHVTLLPFAALLVAAWSVADRDLAALPVLAVTASFVLQTHTGYVLLAPGLVVTAGALLAWQLVAERRAAAADRTSTDPASTDPAPDSTSTDPAPAGPAPAAGRGTPLRRWAAIAALVALVCWAPPLYEQIAHEGGNVTFLTEAGGEGYGAQTYSSSTAIRLFAATFALPPWWLPPSMESPAISMNGDGPPLALSLLILAGLAGALVAGARWARRRGDLTLATGLVVAIVAVGLSILSVAYSPTPFFALKETAYAKFIWITAAFVTVVAVLGGLDALRRRARPVDRHAAVAFAAVAVVAGLLALPTADRAHTGSTRVARGSHDLADAVIPAVDGRGTVLVEFGPPLTPIHWYGPALVAEMVGAGVPVVVRDPDLVAQLGDHRAYVDGEAQLQLFILPGDEPPMWGPDAELVTSVGGRTAGERAELATLHDELRRTLARDDGLPLAPRAALGEQTAASAQVVDIDRLWTELEKLDGDPDPDSVLESDTAGTLFAFLDMLGLADEALDGDFPTDDLVRYYELQAIPEQAEMSAWLVDLN